MEVAIVLVMAMVRVTVTALFWKKLEVSRITLESSLLSDSKVAVTHSLSYQG